MKDDIVLNLKHIVKTMETVRFSQLDQNPSGVRDLLGYAVTQAERVVKMLEGADPATLGLHAFVCPACGQPWTGQPCAQLANYAGTGTAVCYGVPVDDPGKALRDMAIERFDRHLAEASAAGKTWWVEFCMKALDDLVEARLRIAALEEQVREAGATSVRP